MEISPSAEPKLEPLFRIQYPPGDLTKLCLPLQPGGPVGGLLFGQKDGDIVRVSRAELCLGEDAIHDVKRMCVCLASARQAGELKPIGWFRCTYGELAFSEADMDVHARCFPERWQPLLILKLDTTKPPRGTFFFPNCEGALKTGRANDFVLPLADRRDAAAFDGHTPADFEKGGISERPSPFVKSHASRQFARWVTSALLAGGILGGAFWYRSGRIVPTAVTPASANEIAELSRAPSLIRLVTIEEDGQLQILWDPSVPALQRSSGGALLIDDGDESNRYALTPAVLQTGSFTYARRGARVDVTLQVMTPDNGMIVQATTYVSKRAQRTAAEEQTTTEIRELQAELTEAKRRADDLERQLALTRRELEKERSRAGGRKR